MVRGDDVVLISQMWDQVAEHERAGREAVQQHDDRCVGGAGLAVEDPTSADGGVAVVNLRHRSNSFERN
jgi:hypothetical protein